MAKNRRLKGWFLWVLTVTGAFAGCGSSNNQGAQCCALHRFCTTCTTCEPGEISAGSGTDETACRSVNDHFKAVGQFCNLGNSPPAHTIGEFILQCGG